MNERVEKSVQYLIARLTVEETVLHFPCLLFTYNLVEAPTTPYHLHLPFASYILHIVSSHLFLLHEHDYDFLDIFSKPNKVSAIE